MTKKLKNIIKGFIITSATVFFMKISPNLIWYHDRSSRILNPLIQEKTCAEELFAEPYGYDDEFGARFFLNRANFAVRCKIDYKKMTMDGKPDEDSLFLAGGFGDCRAISDFTYSNYIYMVKRSGNQQLLDMVRVASGYAKGSDGQYRGHRWLEGKLEGEWLIFEATRNDKSFYAKNDFLEVIGEEWRHALYIKDDYYPLYYFMIDSKGRYKVDVDWKNVFLDTHGTTSWPSFVGILFSR